jgi:hypothetical protein
MIDAHPGDVTGDSFLAALFPLLPAGASRIVRCIPARNPA